MIRMEKDKNTASVWVDARIYPLSCIMKTAYSFTKDFYLHLLKESDDVVRVNIKSKNRIAISDDDIAEFCNELLNQAIRLQISQDTKGLREIIMARALFDTCIQMGEPSEIMEPVKNFNIEDIAINWFLKAKDENE